MLWLGGMLAWLLMVCFFCGLVVAALLGHFVCLILNCNDVHFFDDCCYCLCCLCFRGDLELCTVRIVCCGVLWLVIIWVSMDGTACCYLFDDL